MSGKRISWILLVKAFLSSRVRRETDIGMLTYKCRISLGPSEQSVGSHFPKMHLRSGDIWTPDIDETFEVVDLLESVRRHFPWFL
jgi:hypothetical protein